MPSVECERDAQCQNDQGCDGAERCVEGSCEAGDAPRCEHGMACAEQEGARCVYEHPSPWLLTVGTGTIRGLPIAEIGKHEQLPALATREVEQALTGFDRVTFAPNGNVALIFANESQFGSSLRALRFGPGMPGELSDIPGLPSWGDFWNQALFSADSKRALITDNYSGLYLVDFSEDPRPTLRLGDERGDLRAEAFCSDSRSWLQYWDGQYEIATEADGNVQTYVLGAGHYALSPDASLLAFTVTDDTGDEVVRLLPCSAQSWVQEIHEAAEVRFSPTSKQLLLHLKAGGLKVVSIQDPRHPAEVWADSTALLSDVAEFVRDGSRLLFERLEGDAEEPTIHGVDLTDPDEPFVYSLRLPPSARIVARNESAVLAWSRPFYDEPRDMLWQTLLPSSEAEPVVVFSDASYGTSIHGTSPYDGSVLLERESDTGTALSRLRYDGSSFEQTLIKSFPGTIDDTAWSPDGRAVALIVTGAPTDNKVWWVTFSDAAEASQPLLLAEESLRVSIQPWP